MPVVDETKKPAQSGINVLEPGGQQQPGVSGGAQQVDPNQQQVGAGSGFTSSAQSTQPGSGSEGTNSQPVKLQNYLDANAGQGQNIMSQVQKTQSSQADEIRKQVEAQRAGVMQNLFGVQQTQQNLSQGYTNDEGTQFQGILGPNNQGGFVNQVGQFGSGTNLQNFTNNEQNQQVKDWNKGLVQKTQDIYSGNYNPQQYNMDQQKLAAAQRRADSASKMFKGLGTDDYRKMIIQKTFGKNRQNMTRGQNSLDNLFLGRGTSEEEQRTFLNKMQNLGNTTQSSIDQARSDVRNQQNKNTNQYGQIRNNLTDRLDTLYGKKDGDNYTSGIGSDIQERLNARTTADEDIRQSFTDEGDFDLTPEQLERLGLSADERLYGTSKGIPNYLKPNTTYGDVATKEELSRLEALAALRGQISGQDIIADKSRVGQLESYDTTQRGKLKDYILRNKERVDGMAPDWGTYNLSDTSQVKALYDRYEGLADKLKSEGKYSQLGNRFREDLYNSDVQDFNTKRLNLGLLYGNKAVLDQFNNTMNYDPGTGLSGADAVGAMEALDKIAKPIRSAAKHTFDPRKSIQNSVMPKPVRRAVKKAVRRIFCHHEDTMVKMANDTFKPIGEIKIGDIVAEGGKVTLAGSMISEYDMYEYKNEIMTGSHPIQEDGKWMNAEDSELAIRKPEMDGSIICPLETDEGIYTTKSGYLSGTLDFELEELIEKKEANKYVEANKISQEG